MRSSVFLFAYGFAVRQNAERYHNALAEHSNAPLDRAEGDRKVAVPSMEGISPIC
jgi:hypothetical protein